MNAKYKVSVIVPIYNVEKFITRCVETLMEQTLPEVEFIFVNDATPDNSWNILNEVLKKYPARCSDVILLEHDLNKGLPVARNTGLSIAHGEYIFHCDSDDFVEHDMLECLYNKAIEENADIVWCDWFLSFEKSERYMKQPCFTSAMDALKAMLGGGMKYNVWNKLVRRSLYVENNISFPAGHGMGEDMTMMLLFVYASNVVYLSKAFYHYVKTNSGAYTQNHSKRNLEDLKYNVERIEKFLYQLYGTSLDKEIAFLKLDVKFPFLIMGTSIQQYKEWTNLYPEANKYICQNNYISFRSRVLEWFAWKKQWWIVRLYYWIVIKFVYGVIYK